MRELGNGWLRHKHVLVLVLLLVSGLVRGPLESRVKSELLEQGFFPRAREVAFAEQVGVQGLIGVLGGLRYMVATFLELEAYALWEPPPRWAELAETYHIVNLLQPRNIESWDTAAWHLAYNASAYYRDLDDQVMIPLQREAVALEYETRGIETLRKGIRWNPDALTLYSKLGDVYRFKRRDFCSAAEVYRAASAVEKAPRFYFRFLGYALAKCPGKEEEAYRVLREVYLEGLEILRVGGPMIWKPTLIVEMNRLELYLNVEEHQRIPERFDEESFRIATPWKPEESLEIYRSLVRRDGGRDPALHRILESLENQTNESR